jgi:hypothetical protein
MLTLAATVVGVSTMYEASRGFTVHGLHRDGGSVSGDMARYRFQFVTMTT